MGGERSADERAPGTVLADRWRIDALLGRGAMAVVYAATDRDGQAVAIKLLHPRLADHPGLRARFFQEAQIWRLLRHPVLVEIHEVGEADGAPLLVMERLEGETLGDRWQRSGGRLPVELVLAAASAVLDALGAAHGAGIVHRDVKPQNLFLTRGGATKLLDFGLARHGATVGSAGAPATAAGAALGTPAFMSPEQARGRWDLLDGRSDLWSLGATLFTLLSGQLLRTGTISEQIVQAMSVPAPPLATHAPELPAPLLELVDRALALDPKRRFGSAREMKAAVDRLLRLHQDAPTERRPTVQPPAAFDPETTLPPPGLQQTARYQTFVPADPAPPRRPFDAARFPPFPPLRSRPAHDATLGKASLDAIQSDVYVEHAVKRMDSDLLEALDELTLAVATCPTNALARYGCGVARHRMEDYEGAIEDYGAALRLSADLVEARFNRGLCRLQLGDLAGGRADLERAEGELLVRQDTAALTVLRELFETLDRLGAR